MSGFELVRTPTFDKRLRKLDRQIQRRVLVALFELVELPDPTERLKPLRLSLAEPCSSTPTALIVFASRLSRQGRRFRRLTRPELRPCPRILVRPGAWAIRLRRGGFVLYLKCMSLAS